MFDEIFIKEMSPIDAYKYGRQIAEKELNEIHLCECKQIRAEAIEEFAEKIRAYSGEHYIDCDGYGCKTDLVFMTDAFLDDIVEQLKEQK